MKKFYILLIGLISLTAFTSCQKSDGYKLSVHVKGVNNGVAYLCEKGTGFGPVNTRTAIDSAQLKDGSCLFEGVVKKPTMADLVVKPVKDEGNFPFKQFAFVLENKTFQMVCDFAKGSFLSGERPEIEGSPLNDQSNVFAKTLDPIISKRSQLFGELRQAKLRKDQDQIDALNQEVNHLEELYHENMLGLIEKNPGNIELCFLVSKNYSRSNDYPLLEQLLEKFDTSMYQTIFLKPLVQRIEGWKRTKLGSIAPEITAKDVAGTSHSLSDFRGKYVLVDFWASWCPPCCKEIPEIAKLYSHYKDKQFEVFGVSFDSKAKNWKKALIKFNMEWINVSNLDRGKNEAAQYAITGIPYNVLLDPEGKIIAKNLHGEDLEKKLKEVLGE